MKKAEGKHVVILAENQYEDLELWYPKLRLHEEKAIVTVAAMKPDIYYSKHGYPVEIDATLDKLEVHGVDAVIIPGGYAPDHMRRHPAMVDFVREASKQQKIIAAICHAGWMLVSANIIRGKKVTGFFSIKDDLVNAGGLYEDSPVVRDGHIITSRMPNDLPAFCQEIIEAMSDIHMTAAPS